MKKFNKICCVILSIVSIIFLTSCKTEGNNSNEPSTETTQTYSPIKDLIWAVKKNPTEYNNKQITLKGTILKENGKTFLLDYHDYIDSSDLKDSGEITGSNLEFTYQERNKAKNSTRVKVILLDNIQSYVVESYDYVKITGIVKITNEEIYLDNCGCTILVIGDDRGL